MRALLAKGYKGKGTTLHLLVDKNEMPANIIATAANIDEKRVVERLLTKLPKMRENAPMRILEADKGYDAGWLRQKLLGHMILPRIPYRKIAGRRDVPNP